MSRPQKQTVDYFPHNCKHGKTIYILEQHYQAKGYAFWFKLLEELGTHEGHYINLKDESEIEFLAAKTWFPAEEIIEILNLLSKIGAIDKKLWENKIIWSDNFVQNVSAVYSKRTVSVPEKPVSDTENIVSDNGNLQSKVEYNIVKKSNNMCKEDFNLFWEKYPRKINKKTAENKFLKLNKSLLPRILESIEEYKKTEQWRKEERFIPHPSTWLNGERWNDEIKEEKKKLLIEYPADVSERRIL